jgi:hypothetical protein
MGIGLTKVQEQPHYKSTLKRVIICPKCLIPNKIRIGYLCMFFTFNIKILMAVDQTVL